VRGAALVLAVAIAACAGTARADPSSSSDETDAQERARRIHWDLKLATAASLLVTGTLGGIVAANQTTTLHTGKCESGDPIAGSYGCGSLSTVHGISAVTSLALYASTASLELGVAGVPAPDKIAPHAKLWTGLTWFHRTAIVIQPLLGILARFPDVIGIDSAENQRSFSKNVRTVHAGLGIATIAAYLGTVAIEW
jgi:hypothetical protein